MGSKQKSLHASSWLRSRRGPLASSSGARRLIAGAVRESVQLEGQCRGAAALLPQHQPWPSDPVLAHFAWMTGSKRRPTHRAPPGRAWKQQRGAAAPRRCNLESGRPPAGHGTRGSPRKDASARTDADGRFDDSRRPRRTVASNGSRSSAGRVSSERHRRRLGRSLLAHCDHAQRRPRAYGPRRSAHVRTGHGGGRPDPHLTVIERGFGRRSRQEVGPPDRKLWVRRARLVAARPG